MTATADASGLSDATGQSVAIVMKSLGGAVSSTLGVIATPVLAFVAIVAVVLVVLAVRRLAREVREARRQIDPRERFDPLASDVLGEWS